MSETYSGIITYEPCINGTQNAAWAVSEYNGSKAVGITINGPGCITEIVPSCLIIPNTSYSRYIVDVSFPISVFKDRNVNFLFNDLIQGCTVKIINSQNLKIYKTVDKEYGLGEALYQPILNANSTYRFRIDVISNKISIYIDDLLVHTVQDTSPLLPEGSIALQASIGTLGPVNVYFDNIEVYDLTPPTPTPTPPFPYFSQRDSNWKDNIYDSLNRTIEEGGCALTSAVMVLQSHGIDKITWGEGLRDLDPGTLNDWLNAQQMSDGYWKKGMTSWSAITRLTKALNANNSAYTKLEYQTIEATEQGKMYHILSTSKNPLIFKHTEPQSPSSFRFVVATEKLATDSGQLYPQKKIPSSIHVLNLPYPQLNYQKPAIFIPPIQTSVISIFIPINKFFPCSFHPKMKRQACKMKCVCSKSLDQ